LKNDNSALPLNKNKVTKVALLGPLLKENTKTMFENAVGNSAIKFTAERGFALTNEKGGAPKLLDRDPKTIAKLVNIAKKADVVVLFLGGDKFTAKEAYFSNSTLGDRATIEPVGAQDELVEKIKALGKKVIVVLKHRRTLAINTIAKEADAILDTWDLSEFGDQSTAKIIFGEFSPSGKISCNNTKINRAITIPL
jgi:Glycosyl hydrolase family 3 C terminal domain.